MSDDETNKYRQVVGLKYEKGQGLPMVIVKGGGYIAEAILEQQRKYSGPPLIKDEKLLKELYKLPIDAEINKELFELVALLLVHVFNLEKKLKEDRQ